jgi:hypothetical protein
MGHTESWPREWFPTVRKQRRGGISLRIVEILQQTGPEFGTIGFPYLWGHIIGSKLRQFTVSALNRHFLVIWRHNYLHSFWTPWWITINWRWLNASGMVCVGYTQTSHHLIYRTWTSAGVLETVPCGYGGLLYISGGPHPLLTAWCFGVTPTVCQKGMSSLQGNKSDSHQPLECTAGKPHGPTQQAYPVRSQVVVGQAQVGQAVVVDKGWGQHLAASSCEATVVQSARKQHPGNEVCC